MYKIKDMNYQDFTVIKTLIKEERQRVLGQSVNCKTEAAIQNQSRLLCQLVRMLQSIEKTESDTGIDFRMASIEKEDYNVLTESIKRSVHLRVNRILGDPNNIKTMEDNAKGIIEICNLMRKIEIDSYQIKPAK